MQRQRIVESIADRAHALVRQQRIELACGFQALVRGLKLPCPPSRSQCGLCHLGGVLVGGRQVGDSKRPAAQLCSHTATRRGRWRVVHADDDGQLLARSDILPHWRRGKAEVWRGSRVVRRRQPEARRRRWWRWRPPREHRDGFTEGRRIARTSRGRGRENEVNRVSRHASVRARTTRQQRAHPRRWWRGATSGHLHLLRAAGAWPPLSRLHAGIPHDGAPRLDAGIPHRRSTLNARIAHRRSALNARITHRRSPRLDAPIPHDRSVAAHHRILHHGARACAKRDPFGSTCGRWRRARAQTSKQPLGQVLAVML